MNNQNMIETVTRISGVNPRKCMRCGKCSASCPAYDEMEYHPHQFVSMVENGRIEELLSSKGIYTCLSCLPVSSAVPETWSRRSSLRLCAMPCSASRAWIT